MRTISPTAARPSSEGSAAAIIVAAGPATRMQGYEKLWAPVLGRPLLGWTISAFVEITEIEQIVVVVASDRLASAEELVRHEGWGKVMVAVGGPRRRDSVQAGLAALGRDIAYVVVHDGSRPLVTPEMVCAGLAAARNSGAATAGEPVKETIKRARDGLVIETVPRAELVRTQTPQVFARAELLKAHAACPIDLDPPDDAALFVALGLPLVIFPGSHDNLKVTTPDDLPVAEALLARRIPK